MTLPDRYPHRCGSSRTLRWRRSSFAARVIAWQRAHGRHDLPWQDTRDAYRIWLSEVMLQQTQVATVLPYFARFIAAFPTVAALAAAPLSRVLERWSGLGYYRRAHHLHAAARVVVERARRPLSRPMPRRSTTLPGIGRSTAAAIAAFAGGERGAILDGNVKRVLARHRGIDGMARRRRPFRHSYGAPPKRCCRIPAATAIAAYTQGMMDLGATVCTRARPRCGECPVRDDCIARRDGRIARAAVAASAQAVAAARDHMLLLERNGEILLEQRPPLGIWGGLWSFPEMPVGDDFAVHCRTRFGATRRFHRGVLPFEARLHALRADDASRPYACRSVAGRRRDAGDRWFAVDAAIAAAVPAPVLRLLRVLRAREGNPFGRQLMPEHQ